MHLLLPKMISRRRIVCISLIATVAATFSIAAAMSLLVPFPSGQQQEAMAQQQNSTTTTTTTPSASTNRAFNLYNIEVPGSTDTYIYSLPVIVVHRGDSVTVSLHNIAETGGGTTDTSEGGGTRDTSEGGGTTDTSEQGGGRLTEGGGGTTDTSEGGGGGTQTTMSTEGRHSFTITTPPYSVNIDTAAGETRNATFTADQPGIFHYFCKYHPETMTGELVVLPPSSSSSSAASSRPAM
jgi:plastocyanin